MHVTIVERRGRIFDQSSTNPSQTSLTTPLKYTATPTHDFQTLLHTDVPNVAGRAMDKMGYGGGYGCTLRNGWLFTGFRLHGRRRVVDLQLQGWLPAGDGCGNEA